MRLMGHLQLGATARSHDASPGAYQPCTRCLSNACDQLIRHGRWLSRMARPAHLALLARR
eukprot:2618194-Lingulodinium_polyedra.AAC.1